MKSTSPELKDLYQQMADLTKPKCANCRLPYSCCSTEYCLETIDYAKEVFNVDLIKTDHPKLPLMGVEGCMADPYLRPMCTYHTCDINSLGCDPRDHKWTEEYFQLRDKIDELSFKELE
jgi:hypothetical protein